ncbi:MAG: nicotinate-nucleotide--dimethylbenzimidazole phosphoribosyltransferase [Deferribacteraceae bacterium]|nr:nicotinate-nucleotide--dimethylbenzimidazole phosphoribosyltransferase [Deferribacteraceae bacterium]
MKYNVTPTDREIHKAATERTTALAMPYRAMGEINTLSEKLCAIQGTLKPQVDKRGLFIMAGDHGICAEGVSMHPQEITMILIQTMLLGISSVCVYAKHANTKVFLADMGVLGDVAVPANATTTFYDRKIARGTKNFAHEPAMTREEAERSIEIGFQLATAAIKEHNLNLIAVGEMGIGNTTPSSAIAAVYTALSVEELVGRGAGLDDDGVNRKINAVKAGLALHNPQANDPIGVLASVGGFDIGGMAGVILAAATAKIPVVLDGFISTAAAVIANTIAPNAHEYMIAGHESYEVGHKHLLKMLGLSPLLQLGMRLGEGTGAVCAIPLVEFAAATIQEIVTLEDAAV